MASPVKAIQDELKAISALAADLQDVSSVKDISTIAILSIFVDHAKDHASASVGAGTKYEVQVSQKASGDDTWRTIFSWQAGITAPTAVVTDGEEAAGQTVIECGAAVPEVGDKLIFKNSTLSLSEWVEVVARVTTGGSETFTIRDGLTNIQAAGTYYTQGEHFYCVLDVSAFTRLRVIANNNLGTTNRAIVWRCACIAMTGIA